MEATASKVLSSPVITSRQIEIEQLIGHLSTAKLNFSNHGLQNEHKKPFRSSFSKNSPVLCLSIGSHHDCVETHSVSIDSQIWTNAKNGDDKDEHPIMFKRTCRASQGLDEACQFAYNDAKFVNERARNDILLLSRGIMSLDARARQDVSILGLEFLKLDARAREDTELMDRNVKKKAERLQRIATTLREKARSRLKTVADKHWNDGALEADLRRADPRAKQRAMEDALMALEFVKNMHDRMVSKMYRFPLSREKGPPSRSDITGFVTLEKNGESHDFFLGEVSMDRINAIQEVYWSMASALSEADGFDYTDPEELELLIATLIDLDAMDGKSSVSLLAECSSSPDETTRRALANALAAVPSMWTLGNAGMGALQV